MDFVSISLSYFCSKSIFIFLRVCLNLEVEEGDIFTFEDQGQEWLVGLLIVVGVGSNNVLTNIRLVIVSKIPNIKKLQIRRLSRTFLHAIYVKSN
jgi:hypothetical protein